MRREKSKKRIRKTEVTVNAGLVKDHRGNVIEEIARQEKTHPRRESSWGRPG